MKYKLRLEQYVQQVCEIEIEANSVKEACETYHGSDNSDLDFYQGDIVNKRARIYSATDETGKTLSVDLGVYDGRLNYDADLLDDL